RRYGAPLCLIIFDIDNFKNVNDSCGHLYGDFVLREVVARVASGLRTTDILARYGGEEFCGILPETSLKSAIEVAERFRESIASEEYRFHGHSRKITISLGVAALDKNITNTDMFFKKADDALYTAKREGKNKVRSADH
ncbi:MAG: GGDEF domain-containing protein, partial [Candidatus Kuenenia stuttgartiensis]|nr:GGDEF domain-containing protein [Candidatus Kuenenia stuttgartiensis]